MVGVRNCYDLLVIPLGMAPRIGNSCFLVVVGEAVSFLLDCGLRTSAPDGERIPAFEHSVLQSMGYSLARDLDFIILSHAHFDHSGALPFLYSMYPGFSRPVYTTVATKFLLPQMYADYDRVSETGNSSNSHIERTARSAQARASVLDRLETKPINVSFLADLSPTNRSATDPPPRVHVTFSNAGHIIGAVITTVEVEGMAKVVYTGDYNTSARATLPAATLPACAVGADVFITETTYCNISRRPSFYRDALQLADIGQTVRKGNRVLIPTSAMGLCQDIIVKIWSFWERFSLSAERLMLGTGLIKHMTDAQRVLGNYALDTTPFTSLPIYHRMDPFDRSRVQGSSSQWCVICAPNQTKSGVTLDCFVQLADDPNALVAYPGHMPLMGYNWRVMTKTAKQLTFDGLKQPKDIHCRATHLAFNAHVDFNGLVRVIEFLDPRAVLLIHNTAIDNVVRFSQLLEHYYGGRKVICVGNENTPILAVPLRGSGRPRRAYLHQRENAFLTTVQPEKRTGASIYRAEFSESLEAILVRLALQGLIAQRVGSVKIDDTLRDMYRIGEAYYLCSNAVGGVTAQWVGGPEDGKLLLANH
ncbi:Cleavage and polyadenylation specificity factor, 73 kDa subunit [Giardia muris]|uniref:Cleavage and polyadenylation specificity factor, 73 kDa subunit n=1 Tax=Giardia muris TaxID=5742 RepID=A0A4Z1T9S0_GIAMU|nr:Cleavage and polyadenylation specificity factor, 73 kDa subunit [Giardia muris]|eukprot:TNJ29291.1 Cleavage and polyadenylation specificity factor, 73 kDa subunit [Giardia muris]